MILTMIAATLCFQPIELEQIMSDPAWMGELVQDLKPGPDGVYALLSQPLGAQPKWIFIDFDGETRQVEDKGLSRALQESQLQLGDVRVVQVAGDLWLESGDGQREPLLSTGDGLQLVRALGDARFTYRQDGQLMLFDLRAKSGRQLSDLRFEDEDEKSETWFRAQEPELIDYVAYKSSLEESQKQWTERTNRALGKAQTLKLGKGWKLASMGVPDDDALMMDMTDDGHFMVAVLEPESEGEKTTFAEFVNANGAVAAKEARPRVGYDKVSWKLALIDRSDCSVRWVDFSELPGLKIDRRARLDGKSPTQPEDARPIFIVPGGFHASGSDLLVTVYSRDYKDRWICLVNAASAKVRVIHHQVDPAWLQYYFRNMDGSRFVSGRAWWTQQGEVAFLSDESGFQHLYTVGTDGGRLRQLTSGDFEVFTPFQKDGQWFVHANREHPGEIHFYRLHGSRLDRLTQGTGNHNVMLVGDMMVDRMSTATRPPFLRVKQLESKDQWREIYDGRSDAFKAIDWVQPEYVTYPNEEGDKVHARLYTPRNQNGAGVVFIHGAGYLQNAHKGWSGYFREYMFHNLLLQRGYTVLDPDYRASAGYGRDWRTAIYRHMGDRDLADVLIGARYLVDSAGVDVDRIGVYGGSYGGFLTLMALFKHPSTFAAGAALRPVTDWAYYNDWYVGRILNTPETDPKAYKDSSPIYFAEGLEDSLLICHGMVDDNVQFQDSVRLAQRLIELGKDHWTLSGYPVEPHGFVMPTSWRDEYGRILDLFENRINARNGE